MCKGNKSIAVKIASMSLSVALILPLMGGNISEAASKPKLNKSKITMTAGSSFKLKVTGVKKVKWSINKSKIAKLTSKKKTTVKINAKKAGKAVVTAKYTLKGKSKKLTCKVVVNAKNIDDVTPSVAPTAVPSPTQTAPVQTQAPVPSGNPTEQPTATPVPTEVPSPTVVSNNGTWAYIPVEDDSLLKEYQSIFGNVGTCLTYSGFKTELQDRKTLDFVQKNYNSFTLENEMKPSYLLADPENNFFNPPFNQLVSCDNAEALGYTIPDGYTESDVPLINYDNLDKIMKIAAENGLRMRGHTLIWHSQTPMEFFKVGYKKNASFVTPEVMDQRIIYFVTNVMKHICESEYGEVVYCWDLTNEYFHQISDGSDANWREVYDIATGSTLVTNPSYVKLAFKVAYDVLKEYGLEEKVPLFYNDYNTSQVSDEIVKLVNYINEADELNPDGTKLCVGVGMQCHLDVKWPSVTEQLSTVKKFIDAGFEVQITELDIINSNDAPVEDHYDYWFKFMKGLVDFVRDGAKITGVTFWGLSDSVSWRYGEEALLYGDSINDPKKTLYAVYAAAQTSWDWKK